MPERYRTIVAKVYWITTDATGYALLAFNNEEMARRHADRAGRVVVEVVPSGEFGGVMEAPSDEAFRAARAAYDAGDDLEDALIAAYAIDYSRARVCPARSWRDTGCICPHGGDAFRNALPHGEVA